MEETTVSSESVAVYEGLIVHFARRLAGQRGAEFDDLLQEGRLHVLLKLREGLAPTSNSILNAMRDWARKTSRLGIRVTERSPNKG